MKIFSCRNVGTTSSHVPSSSHAFEVLPPVKSGQYIDMQLTKIICLPICLWSLFVFVCLCFCDQVWYLCICLFGFTLGRPGFKNTLLEWPKLIMMTSNYPRGATIIVSGCRVKNLLDTFLCILKSISSFRFSSKSKKFYKNNHLLNLNSIFIGKLQFGVIYGNFQKRNNIIIVKPADFL